MRCTNHIRCSAAPNQSTGTVSPLVRPQFPHAQCDKIYDQCAPYYHSDGMRAHRALIKVTNFLPHTPWRPSQNYRCQRNTQLASDDSPCSNTFIKYLLVLLPRKRHFFLKINLRCPCCCDTAFVGSPSMAYIELRFALDGFV